jgi:NAD(P)-dependent dehydrogenase (short-subunit alcohol dehydrogenase family)
MGRLEGKIVVVTGGTSGIGLASAKLFAAEGARLFITGRGQSSLDSAVTAIGGGTTGVRGDVGDLDDLDRLFTIIKEEAGRIDVLFANAGGGEFAFLGDITEKHFDDTFRTNVKGTLFTVQKALPLLHAGSSVILTGSTAAVTGTHGFSVYSSTKAAIRSFARGWILDLKGRGIRVNVLAPGATSTPGWNDLSATNADRAAMVDAVAANTPLGRLANPEETARAALFLASDDSSFVTGSVLFVDGGSAQI